MEVSYGLAKESVDVIVGGLQVLLANTHVLYVKTRNYHWNMQDPRFQFLHEFLQSQYEALADAGDEIAERIRMMGRPSPGSLKEFASMATLGEAKYGISADDMLADLADSHEKTVVGIRNIIGECDSLGDPGTSDLLAGLLRDHEKTAWLIRSHL